MEFFGQNFSSSLGDPFAPRQHIVPGPTPNSAPTNLALSSTLDYSKTAQEYLLTSFYKKIKGFSKENDQEYVLFMKLNKPSEKPASIYFPSKPSDMKRYKGYYLTGPEILDFYEAEKNTVHKK